MKRDISRKLDVWLRSGNRKPLLLQGARQVGKTYSLKDFGAKRFTKTHYVNFEGNLDFSSAFQGALKPSAIIRDLGLVLGSPVDPESDLLILDEIQQCPEALTSLKYFAEEMPQLAICAAGSLLGVRLGETSFPVGKVDDLRMSAMSFGEFLAAACNPMLSEAFDAADPRDPVSPALHEQLWRAFREYLVVGGMPEAVKAFATLRGEDEFFAFQEVRRIQTQLLLGYTADMAKHCGKQNAMHIERLWRNVPAQLARDADGSAPKFVFKDVLPGVKGYSRLSGVIDWLEAAGLAIRLPVVNSGLLPFSAYMKENAFKLFVFDVGLLGALSGLPVRTLLAFTFGSYKGYIAENAVAQAFMTEGRTDIVCWREGQAEVEFLTVLDGSVVPIEVKSGHVTQAKSLKSFSDKYNPSFSVIFSGRNAGYDQNTKRRYYPLYFASKFPDISRAQMTTHRESAGG
jgi:predicted AAA+ superfamily ATPase